jgi:hypothetical protein
VVWTPVGGLLTRRQNWPPGESGMTRQLGGEIGGDSILRCDASPGVLGATGSTGEARWIVSELAEHPSRDETESAQTSHDPVG